MHLNFALNFLSSYSSATCIKLSFQNLKMVDVNRCWSISLLSCGFSREKNKGGKPGGEGLRKLFLILNYSWSINTEYCLTFLHYQFLFLVPVVYITWLLKSVRLLTSSTWNSAKFMISTRVQTDFHKQIHKSTILRLSEDFFFPYEVEKCYWPFGMIGTVCTVI